MERTDRLPGLAFLTIDSWPGSSLTRSSSLSKKEVCTEYVCPFFLLSLSSCYY